MNTILLAVDAALVASLGVWMTVAVADNWSNPRLNEEVLAAVMRFDLMAVEYPEDFALIAHRRIDDPRRIGFLFRAVRMVETIAAVALLLSSLLLLLAAAGAVSGWAATGAAILAVTFFSLIWAGFVIGGNYFAYWYCHPWAQSNHFMLMFWGLFVLLILLV